MFKLVVLSVCVALAIAKPSGTLHGIPAIPSAISHQEVISSPVISTYAAAPVFSALPAATSYSYSNKIDSASAVHTVSSGPVITKAFATPVETRVATAPAATSYSFQSRIDSAPVTAELLQSQVVTAPVVTKVAALPAATSYSFQSHIDSAPAIAKLVETPVFTKIATATVGTKVAAVPAATSHSFRSGIVDETPLLGNAAAAQEANKTLAAPVVAKSSTVETKFADIPANIGTHFVGFPINYVSAVHPAVSSYLAPAFTTRFANLELASNC